MSHCAFSNAAHDCAAQTSSAMCRDNNQINTFFCRNLMNCAGAVSGNSAAIDRDTVEIDAAQETFHLVTTLMLRCFDISPRTIVAARGGHHHRAEVGDMHDNDAGAEVSGELNRVRQTCQRTIREVDRH
jgi:hypothetical protein